jgi:methyl-accepting chemotaxis protein
MQSRIKMKTSKTSWLSNLPFLWKVSLAPAFVTLVLIGLSIYAYINLTRTSGALDVLIKQRLQTQRQLTEIEVGFAMYERNLYRTVTDFGGTQDAAVLERQAGSLNSQMNDVRSRLLDYRKSNATVDAQQFSTIQASLKKYDDGASAVFEMLQIDFAGAVGFVKPLAAHGQIVEKSIGKLIEDGNKELSSDIVVLQNDLTAQRNWFFWTVLVALVGAISVALKIAQVVRQSIIEVADVTATLAAGNTTIDLDTYKRGDELNLVIEALVKFKETLVSRNQLEKEQKLLRDQAKAEEEKHREAEKSDRKRDVERENQQQIQRRALLEQLAQDFDAAVKSTIQNLLQRGNDLEASAQALSSRAKTNQNLSSDLAVTANRVMSEMDSAAASTEELSHSVNEISDRIEQSSNSVVKISERAAAAKPVVANLAKAANHIGDIVGVINEIAAQTNLLALNATIEAARAGDAGRGFSVVASEVKALATQTAKSTSEISAQISDMQAIVATVVDAIEIIAQAIETVSGSTTEAASALVQQNASTSEIARNVLDSSGRMTEMAAGADLLTASAKENEHAAQNLSVVLSALRQQCDSLHQASESFGSRILAA